MPPDHTPPRPRAVLWDFDGTLADTEPRWIQVEVEYLADHGIRSSPDEMKSKVGQSAYLTAEQFSELIDKPATQIYRELHDRLCELLRSLELPWLPGSRELAHEIRDAGVPMALVTASNARIMEAVAHGLPDFFEFIVHADMVTRHKPDPEGYQLAISRLGLTPDDVIILEDSTPGVAAATASGAPVLAVPTMARIEPTRRRMVRTSGLAGVTWDELSGIWRQLRGMG